MTQEGGKPYPKGQRGWELVHLTLCEPVVIIHQSKNKVRPSLNHCEKFNAYLDRECSAMHLFPCSLVAASFFQPMSPEQITQNMHDVMLLRHSFAWFVSD